MTGLETCYRALHTAVPDITSERWVELLSLNPRKIFGLERPVIDTKAMALLTVFSPEGKTVFEAGSFYSRSANSAFIGKDLLGTVYGTVRNDKHFFRNKNN